MSALKQGTRFQNEVRGRKRRMSRARPNLGAVGHMQMVARRQEGVEAFNQVRVALEEGGDRGDDAGSVDAVFWVWGWEKCVYT